MNNSEWVRSKNNCFELKNARPPSLFFAAAAAATRPTAPANAVATVAVTGSTTPSNQVAVAPANAVAVVFRTQSQQ